MTENLIEPTKVCVNNSRVIPPKFTLVILSGKKETWSKLTAALVCFQSHSITEGKIHILPPPFVMSTFPYSNFSFQELLFSSSFRPSHPCSTFPVQTEEFILRCQPESTYHQSNTTQTMIICLRLALTLLYFTLYIYPESQPSRALSSSLRGQISQSIYSWLANETSTRKYYQSTMNGFQLQHVVFLPVTTTVPSHPKQATCYVMIPIINNNFIPYIL